MRIVEVDSDGLLEDRAEILRDKLHFPDATVLLQPETISTDNYLNILPPFGIFDFTPISKEHMNITMHHYNIIIKWGGGRRGGGGGGRYGMFKDRYVLS